MNVKELLLDLPLFKMSLEHLQYIIATFEKQCNLYNNLANYVSWDRKAFDECTYRHEGLNGKRFRELSKIKDDDANINFRGYYLGIKAHSYYKEAVKLLEGDISEFDSISIFYNLKLAMYTAINGDMLVKERSNDKLSYASVVYTIIDSYVGYEGDNPWFPGVDQLFELSSLFNDKEPYRLKAYYVDMNYLEKTFEHINLGPNKEKLIEFLKSFIIHPNPFEKEYEV